MALWSLIEINYFLLTYFSLMGFFRVCWRRLGSVGLLVVNWNLRQLPTGAASRTKGSCTLGASLFWRLVLSSKFCWFLRYDGAVRDAESDVGPALRRDGGAAAYEGTGVGVRSRARRRRAVEARGGRFVCFWRCPHGQ